MIEKTSPITQLTQISLYLLLLLGLISCGGNALDNATGGNQQTRTNTVNVPPSVSIGADQEVASGQTVTLVGSSTDTDGTVVSYAWTSDSLTSSIISLTNTKTSTITFLTPFIKQETILKFNIVITDDKGATDTDQIIIKILANNRVLFGPIASATIKSALFSSPDKIIETTISSGGYSITSTGFFNLKLTGIADDTWVLVTAENGQDIDINDDATLDITPTTNKGKLRALATAKDWRRGINISIITELSVNEIMLSPSPNTLNHIQILSILNTEATRFINKDINNDQSLSYLDALSFNPYNDMNKLTTSYVQQLLPIASAIERGITPTTLPTNQKITTNKVPTVTVGNDIRVTAGEAITLTANSTDDSTDTHSLLYQWQQIQSNIVLSSSLNNPTLTFTIPSSTPPNSTFVFQVTVTDSFMAQASDTLLITVIAGNSSPVIHASQNLSSPENTIITLSSTATDKDGSISSYQWQLISGPTSIILIGSQNANIQLRTPEVRPAGATYVFRITATDNQGAQAADTVLVTVTDTNILPVITITPVSTTTDNSQVTILASITDEGLITSQSWTQLSGTLVSNLSGAQSTKLTFSIPDLPISGDTFVFQLTALDDAGDANVANVSFRALNVNRPPSLTATPTHTVLEQDTVTLSIVVNEPDIDGSIVKYIWQQTSATTVTFLSTPTTTVSFLSPPVVAPGSTLNFIVTIEDDQGATATSSIDVFVTHRFITATITTSNKTYTSNYTDKINGQLAYTINHSKQQTFTSTAVIPPAKGTLIFGPTGTFTYVVNDISAYTDDDFFTYQLKLNNNIVSSTGQINILFTETQTAQITFVPMNAARNIASSTTIVLNSTIPLTNSSVSVNGNNANCQGFIQLSKDDFSNCIPLSLMSQSITATHFYRQYIVKPLQRLETNTTYKLKAIPITTIFGVASSSTVHSFVTGQGKILITEISASSSTSDLRWIELYNPSAEYVYLGNFNLRTLAVNHLGVTNSQLFPLPLHTLSPGSYILIRAQSTNSSTQYPDTSTTFFIGTTTLTPFWDTRGFVEIIESSTLLIQDYVRFGNISDSLATPTAWVSASAVDTPQKLGQSISRSTNNTDTNSNVDWSQTRFATPLAPNDVPCSSDTDQDGIPDCSEELGSTFAGLPLHTWGARIGVKDIFIEIDYMDGTNGNRQSIDVGLVPQRQVLQAIVDRFKVHNIAIHFDVGDLYDKASGTNPANFDLGEGSQVPFTTNLGIGFYPSASTTQSFYIYKGQNFNINRLPIFHYMLMANAGGSDGADQISGMAEQLGNDMLITLGNSRYNLATTETQQILLNTQASTMMHELGHNLGLLHGGNEATNYKPNYLSVMNYLYQLNGLPSSSNAGDRYYQQVFSGSSSATNCVSPALSNSNKTDTFLLDFSNGTSSTLDESRLNEANGIGRTGHSAIDFNCNGNSTDTLVIQNINPNESAGATLTILNDYDDWSNLNLIFQDKADAFNNGQPIPAINTQQMSTWSF